MTRWNVSTVFQENFPNLANKGEFLGKYSKWSAYPTNYLVTGQAGLLRPRPDQREGHHGGRYDPSGEPGFIELTSTAPSLPGSSCDGDCGQRPDRIQDRHVAAGFHVVRHSEFLHARACRSPGDTSGSLTAFSRPRRTSWWGAEKRDQGPEPAAGLARSVLEPCTFSTTGHASGLPRWISLYDLHTAHLPAGASVAAGTEAGAGLDSSRLRSATHTRTVRKTPQTSAVSPLARTR